MGRVLEGGGATAGRRPPDARAAARSPHRPGDWRPDAQRPLREGRGPATEAVAQRHAEGADRPLGCERGRPSAMTWERPVHRARVGCCWHRRRLARVRTNWRRNDDIGGHPVSVGRSRGRVRHARMAGDRRRAAQTEHPRGGSRSVALRQKQAPPRVSVAVAMDEWELSSGTRSPPATLSPPSKGSTGVRARSFS